MKNYEGLHYSLKKTITVKTLGSIVFPSF